MLCNTKHTVPQLLVVFFLKIHYTTKAVVYQNILKVTAKCTSVKST